MRKTLLALLTTALASNPVFANQELCRDGSEPRIYGINLDGSKIVDFSGEQAPVTARTPLRGGLVMYTCPNPMYAQTGFPILIDSSTGTHTGNSINQYLPEIFAINELFAAEEYRGKIPSPPEW